jgi:DNA polymerase I-like protein with 3'-5' exonuclease and polymerase domains
MPVFVIRDAAELLQNPTWTEVTKADWVKVGRFLRGEWPQPLPPVIRMRGTLTEQGEAWFHNVLNEPYVVCDTEYDPTTQRMWMFGMLGPTIGALQMTWPLQPIAHVAEHIRRILVTVPSWWQNAKADIPILHRVTGLSGRDYAPGMVDTMLIHSLLWCELPHDLEFLASIHGDHEKLKHLMKEDPWLYNLGDIAETHAVGKRLLVEMVRDSGVQRIYHEFLAPLTPILVDAEHRGIRVDQQAATEARCRLQTRLEWCLNLAQIHAGYPINLGSSQQLCTVLSDELARKVTSVDEDSVATLRNHLVPFDPQEELDETGVLTRLNLGAHPLLETRVLYANAQQYLSHYIQPCLTTSDGRIYPRFNHWAQNTGRWSTVEPPIAQLPMDLRHLLIPDDGETWIQWDWDQIELRLMAALANDPVLLETFERGWDPHTMNMCDVFGFPYPPLRTKDAVDRAPECEVWRVKVGWQGSDDPRRIFAKRFIYRLLYGGKPESAPTIPGAKALNMPPADLIRCSKAWLRAHPAVVRYWRTVEREGLRNREGRTFLGRRWRFLSHKKDRIQRQLYDFGMQGAVADILNHCVIEGDRALHRKGGRMVYTMHDSATFGVPHALVDEAEVTLRNIAERAWNVNGRETVFPATFKRRTA